MGRKPRQWEAAAGRLGRCRPRATVRAAVASFGARPLFGRGGHGAVECVRWKATRRAPRTTGAAGSGAGLIMTCRGETRGATRPPAQDCQGRKGAHADDPAARSRPESVNVRTEREGGSGGAYGRGGACRFDSGLVTLLLRSGGTRDGRSCHDACAAFAPAQAWIRTARQMQGTTAMREKIRPTVGGGSLVPQDVTGP